MAGNLYALITDPEFNALPHQQQIETLAKFDPEFAGLNSDTLQEFKLKMGADKAGIQSAPAEGERSGFFATVGNALANGPRQLMDAVTSSHPIKDLLQPNMDMYNRGTQEQGQGHRFTGAMSKGLAAMPIIGPGIDATAEELAHGNPSGAAGHFVNTMTPFALPSAVEAMPDIPPNALPNTGRALVNVGRGVKAGVKGGIDSWYDGKASIPSAAGAVVGEMVGGHKGAAIGSAVGALPGTVRGVAKGVQGADYLPMLRPPVQRAPVWEGLTTGGGSASSPDLVPWQPSMGMDIEGNMQATLPSGRRVGTGVPKPPPPPKPLSLDQYNIVEGVKNLKEDLATMPRSGQMPTAVEPIPGQLPSGRVPGTGAQAIPIQPSPHIPQWRGLTTGAGPQPVGAMEPLPEVTLPSGRIPGKPQPKEITPVPQATQPAPPPLTRFEMNRMAHARAQELELPGSPSGKNGHPLLTQVAKDVFGEKSWSDLDVVQMRKVYDFLDTHKRMPIKGEL